MAVAGVARATDTSRVPLGERLAWSPEQAAQVYSCFGGGDVLLDSGVLVL